MELSLAITKSLEHLFRYGPPALNYEDNVRIWNSLFLVSDNVIIPRVFHLNNSTISCTVSKDSEKRLLFLYYDLFFADRMAIVKGYRIKSYFIQNFSDREHESIQGNFFLTHWIERITPSKFVPNLTEIEINSNSFITHETSGNKWIKMTVKKEKEHEDVDLYDYFTNFEGEGISSSFT